MKFLILADLHISKEYLTNPKKYKTIIDSNIKEDYDIVLIAGDVFEHYIINTSINPYQYLDFIFDHKPVIFCLGNHEFAYENYNDVINFYNKSTTLFNVYCLDICKKYTFKKWNIIGNVFWYDFSLNKNQLLMKGEIVDGWLDKTIKNFDPIKENLKCQQDIINNIDKTKSNILVTHMVPHILLNSFSESDPISIYNAYSGNQDFLKEIKSFPISFTVCGHTHRRVMKEIYNIPSINIGNDYYFKNQTIKYFIFEEN